MNELLEKYALDEDSEDDPDFIPNIDELNEDSSSSTSLVSSCDDTSSLSESDDENPIEKPSESSESNEVEITATTALLPNSKDTSDPTLKTKMGNSQKNQMSLVSATIPEEQVKDTKDNALIADKTASSTQKSESLALNGNHEDTSKIGNDPFAKKPLKASSLALNKNTNTSMDSNAKSKGNITKSSDIANGF